MKPRIRKIVLPFVFLGIAVGCAAFMMARRIAPEKLEVTERIVPVEVREIVHTTEQVVVRAQGTVTAARKVGIRPEVAGQIVDLSASLVPGGHFVAGETMASIDDRDYRITITARQEAVVRARLALRQERARKVVGL